MKLPSPVQRGKHVHMDVAGDARARRFAHVHADIKPVGTIQPAQRFFGARRQPHHLFQSFLRSRFEGRDVLVRHNHQVTGGIWIQIQDQEIALVSRSTM